MSEKPGQAFVITASSRYYAYWLSQSNIGKNVRIKQLDEKYFRLSPTLVAIFLLVNVSLDSLNIYWLMRIVLSLRNVICERGIFGKAGKTQWQNQKEKTN